MKFSIVEVLVMMLLCTILTVYAVFKALGYLHEAYNHQQQILEQCEKDLPRNQSCVIIAVPKTN